MPTAVFTFAKTPTTGQALVWNGFAFEPGTLTAAASVLSGIVANRIPYGTGTGLTDSANLTFDGSTLTLTGAASISGVTSITNATASTTTGTGSLVLSGGLGVAGAVNTGGNIQVIGSGTPALLVQNTTSASTFAFRQNSSGVLQIAETGINNWITVTKSTGVVAIASSAASTTTTTGALVVSGGIGMAGNLNLGGSFTASRSTAADLLCQVSNTSSSNGAFLYLQSGDGTTSARYSALQVRSAETSPQQWDCGMYGTKDFQIIDDTAAKTFLRVTAATGSVILGNTAANGTTATDGFVYIPTVAGTPTGVPTAVTGKVAFQYDTTNNKLYVYNGAWKATAALT